MTATTTVERERVKLLFLIHILRGYANLVGYLQLRLALYLSDNAQRISNAALLLFEARLDRKDQFCRLLSPLNGLGENGYSFDARGPSRPPVFDQIGDNVG